MESGMEALRRVIEAEERALAGVARGSGERSEGDSGQLKERAVRLVGLRLAWSLVAGTATCS